MPFHTLHDLRKGGVGVKKGKERRGREKGGEEGGRGWRREERDEWRDYKV